MHIYTYIHTFIYCNKMFNLWMLIMLMRYYIYVDRHWPVKSRHWLFRFYRRFTKTQIELSCLEGDATSFYNGNTHSTPRPPLALIIVVCEIQLFLICLINASLIATIKLSINWLRALIKRGDLRPGVYSYSSHGIIHWEKQVGEK